ncbi:hypothetical protein AX14_007269, partial [Amanita brunnescens Koide BX004]
MSHKIKSRHFDNSSKDFLTDVKASVTPTKASSKRPMRPEPRHPTHLSNSPKGLVAGVDAPITHVTTSSEQPTSSESRPLTPLEVFSFVARTHRTSCTHTFASCSTCSRGITCCGCNNLHTAPARLKLRCINCAHYACDKCTTPFCCLCRKPWFPGDSPTIVLANRFRGGACSTKSSKKGSSSSSQSSGPGSLATAHSNRGSPDPFVPAPVPAVPTQSSTDEIDAFADKTVRVSDSIAPCDATIRSGHAPSPSSNLPSGSEHVFSCPNNPLPVITGATEDVPTAVPSRAPSRAASVASASSVGDAGIAKLLQVDPFPIPSDPPALADVIGRIHRRFPLALLKVDDEDPRHFLARDNTRADDIANDVDHLLSPNTTWASLFFFIRDVFKFEAIKGPNPDFHAFLNGIADIWSDSADFNVRESVRTLIDAGRYFPKAEREIDCLEQVAACYKGERKSAREQLKTTEAELSRLRQAANDTLDSNARLLTEIDQLRATDAVNAVHERDEARLALNDVVAHSKTAMSKQVSRYQHLSNIADERGKRIKELELESKEKDDYVIKTEQEHAAIYREHEAAERQVASLKQQLEDTTTLFETAREARRHDQEYFEERVRSFKTHIADLNTRLNLLPAGEAELRVLVTDANERAGIAEE